MKETNSLEMQLRSWVPRRPSPALKERIFGKQTGPSVLQLTGLALRWLVPAAACALLAATVFNQENGMPISATRHEPVMGMIASNQSPVTSISNGLEQLGASFSPTNFEWTNRSDSTSSISSFSPGKIN